MASRPPSSSSSGSRKAQVHNKQQSLRAVSKTKVSQQQRERQAAISSSSVPAKDGVTVATTSQPTAISNPSNGSRTSLGKRKEQDAPDQQQQAQRKQVFKQVLASPLTVNWPLLAAVDAQPILYTLLDMLAHPALRSHVRRVQPTRPDRREMSRSERRKVRKARAEEKATVKDKDKLSDEGLPAIGQPSSSSSAQMDLDASSEQADQSVVKPSALICGINSITRHIEVEISHQSNSTRAVRVEDFPVPATAPSPLRLIFICRSDLNPPKLASHFPMMTCALNAVRHPLSKKADATLLIPLPEGAEMLLAKSLGLRRCAALGVATELLPGEVTQTLFARIAESGLRPLRADWLESAADAALRTREILLARSGLTPAAGALSGLTSNTIVKNVASTAPVNLNAVKLQKKHTREEKKAWRKSLKKEGHGQERKRTADERKQRREKRRRGDPIRETRGRGDNPGKTKRDAVHLEGKTKAAPAPAPSSLV